jgi:hypothetical protein
MAPTYTLTHAPTHACILACIILHAYIYVYISILIYVCIYYVIHVTYIFIHTYTCIILHAYIYVYISILIYVYILCYTCHIYIHTYIYVHHTTCMSWRMWRARALNEHTQQTSRSTASETHPSLPITIMSSYYRTCSLTTECVLLLQQRTHPCQRQ